MSLKQQVRCTCSDTSGAPACRFLAVSASDPTLLPNSQQKGRPQRRLRLPRPWLPMYRCRSLPADPRPAHACVPPAVRPCAKSNSGRKKARRRRRATLTLLLLRRHAQVHSLTAAPGLVSVVLAPLSSRRCLADAAKRSRASRLLARCCAADIFSDSMFARSRCSKSQCPAGHRRSYWMLPTWLQTVRAV
jgi:hypothetical protein